MVIEAAVTTKVDGFLKKCTETGSQLVQMAELIIMLLLQSGLAWKTTINVAEICFHWLNRDGLGMILHDMQELLSEVFSMGFVPSLMNVLVIEVPPETDEWYLKAMELVKQSAGTLAAFTRDGVKYLALRGTHITQGLRCAVLGAKSTDTAMTVDGHINIDKIKATDVLMHEACTKGVAATVISHKVWQQWGKDIILVLQASPTYTFAYT